MSRGEVGLTRRRKRQRKRNEGPRYYRNQRALWDTRWTPNDDALQELIWHAVKEAGTRYNLSRIIGMKYRHLCRITGGETRAVSFNVVDRILARSEVAAQMRDLPWLTVDELVEQGIWKPQQYLTGPKPKKQA